MRNYRNSAGVFYVCVILFLSACGGGSGGDSTPPPPAPSAATTEANPISNDNAVLNGEVTPNGLASTAWFEFGQDNALSIFTKTTARAIGSGTTPVLVNETVLNLSPGTTYYFRVAAQNAAGTSTGTIESFRAALLPPTVSTTAANPVSNDNAVLNGDVNPRGLATDAWFEWGTDPTLNNRTITAEQPLGAGTATVQVYAPLTKLIPGTTYYFRVSARNSVGESKGKIESFKASQIPSTTTNAATSVSSDTATLNGSVNPNGLQTNYWFEWGTDQFLTNPVSTFETPMQGIAAGIFATLPVSAPLPGLSVGTTYYFRMVAGNVEGQSKGAIRSFTTFVPPTVNTAAATSITTSGAILNGDVNPNGYTTETWFEHGTDPALSFYASTTHRQQGSGTSPLPFSEPVSGLSPWGKNYYRAVASNGGGIQKDVIRSFPTGEYYVAVGDSITLGSQDNIPGDDTSLDGRNTGGGFEPILNNLLTAAKGYPHTVVNEGISGNTSDDGRVLITTAGPNNPLSKNLSAKYFLVMYGTNDALNANGPVTKAVYKANMQAIITAIINAGKTPYLAKVPYTTDPSRNLASIRSYNDAINELVLANGIPVTPPDFYEWFRLNTNQLAVGGVHPNGTGYQSMASKWFEVLP